MASNNNSDLSLDDIIRKKRQPVIRGRGGFRRGGITRQQFSTIIPNANNAGGTKFIGNINRRGAQRVVGDARNKIILKNRTKIADARDKLAELAKHKDARFKLEQLRMTRGVPHNIGRNIGANLSIHKNGKSLSLKTKVKARRGFNDLTRQVHSSPLVAPSRNLRNLPRSPIIPLTDYSMDIDEEYVPAPLKPIVRSINNDLPLYLPPPPDFPNFGRSRNPKPLKNKTVLGDRRSGLNLTIVAKNIDARKMPSIHGILKRSHHTESSMHRRSPSTSPVSILKKRPSTSLRSRLTTPSPSPSPPRPQTRRGPPLRPSSPPQAAGYRIVVSNLQNSVTAGDINELFGDIGELMESRLVRPGTAEVIYSSLKDAQKAVDVYHNRQLDGQPMNCFLVNPRNPPTGSYSLAANKTGMSRGPTKSTLPPSSNSSVIPDVSTFYKVLFSKH